MNRPHSGPNLPKYPRNTSSVPRLPVPSAHSTQPVTYRSTATLQWKSSYRDARMTEDSEEDSFKFSDLRRRFEQTNGKNGGEGGSTVPRNGPSPTPSGSVAANISRNGNGNAAAAAALRPPNRPLPPPRPPTAIKPVFSSSIPGPSRGPQPTHPIVNPLLQRRKPPLAPKPKYLLPDYKPAPATSPKQEKETTANTESLESVRVRAKRIADQLYGQAEKRMSCSLRILTENGGGGSVPGTPIHLSAPPLPTMHEHDENDEEESRVEITNGHVYDSDGDDSEMDSEESRSTADTVSHQGGFGRLSHRYASSTSGYGGSSDMHSAIMRELVSKGITGATVGSSSSTLPNSIGSMRAASTRQQARSVSGSALNATSPKSDLHSAASSSTHSFIDTASGSGILATSVSSGPSLLQEVADVHVPDYSTGDEKEDSRLKKLHYAALEFLTVQRMFVEYLGMIINIYPSYLAEYGEKSGRPVITSPASSTIAENLHVVQRVQRLLIPYHEFHKVLLKEIGDLMDGWTSLDPQMSKIFAKTAPMLKMCVQFLKEKSRIADEMTRLIKEDSDFAAATLMFEQHVFKRGVGAVIQQLDQVHQNFMRYKLLMQSYIKFLPEDSEEWHRTDKVIKILEAINMEVNQSMGLPTSDQLMRLATLFQGQFDVFKPGRRLIRQENVDKQTRKDTQPRTLVLFSDTLWLCRVMSSLGSTGMFDMTRSYAIPIEEVRLEVTDHFDYDCYMEILSKRKSAGLWFKMASARDEWKKLIEKAKSDTIALKERLHAARKRTSRTIVTTTPDIGDPSVGSLARSDSGLSAAAAEAAAIPSRQAPPPPPVRPHSILISSEGGGHTHRRMSEDDNEEADFAQSEEGEEELVTPVAGLDEWPNGLHVEQTRSDSRNGETRIAPLLPNSDSQSITHSNSPQMEIGEQPVWINDQMSTKCLMEGCDNDFNLFQRRHHCRNCGWLICKKCRGYAPVQRLRFEREIVCPECFDDIENAYQEGKLFPANLLVEMQPGVLWLAVKKGKKGKERIERVHPATLFTPPVHRGLKRMQNIDQRMRQSGTVFGKVFLKTKKGESERHAHLADDGLVLAFYKAAFDKHPTEQHVIYGFSLTEEDVVTESGRPTSGKRFNLRHKNQHGSEHQRVISFRVLSDSSAKMWSAALNKALKDESLEDEEDN